MKKKIVIILGLLIVAMIAYFALRPNMKTRYNVLASQPIKRGSIRIYSDQTGIMKPQVGALVNIGAQATGTLIKVNVKVGDVVHKGEIVAVIDSSEIDAQIAQAKANLGSALVNQEIVASSYPLKINEANSTLISSLAVANFIRNNHRRFVALSKDGVIAKDALEENRKNFVNGLQDASIKNSTLVRLKQEFKDQTMITAFAVEQAKAALKVLEVQRSYYEIIAPMDGIVSLVSAQEGETVVARLNVQSLVSIVDPTKLEMWTYIDETDIGQVKANQRVEFTVDTYKDRVFNSTIRTINPMPELKDGVIYYTAISDIDARQAELLRPNMTTQVKIIADEKHNVLLAPNSAIKWINSTEIVFFKKGNSFLQIAPKFGVRDDMNTEIISGLSENDIIGTDVEIANGKSQLAKGKK